MHDAWKPPGPEWVSLAPGVRWLIWPYNGDLQAIVSAKVAKTVAGVFESRAALDDLGFDAEELGALGDLNVLAGLSVFCGAVFAAELIVKEWTGIDHAQTGEPIPVSPEAIRAALRYGTPEGGPALLGPFMAWLERPRQPIAADVRRLRALAKWEHGGGLTHCQGCAIAAAPCASGGTDGGAPCPSKVNLPQTEPGIAARAAAANHGVWLRAGMAGQLVGLHYGQCLEIARASQSALDEGAFIRCLCAIEAGALEAAAERARKDGES